METTDPLITNNGSLGELWLNTTSGELYACTDITTDANIWTNVGDGTGNITPNDPPGNPTNTTIADQSHESSFNHTFTGGTDTDGTVTHYIVDEIIGDASGNVVANPMTVALAEVPVGVPHQFTIPTLTEQTSISFRVRSKDNSGSYSSGVTVTFVGITFFAIGGLITDWDKDSVSYKIHTFLSSGNFVTSGGKPFDMLIVAGGGGAGYASTSYWGGGGGGAGGVQWITGINLSPGSNTIIVGAGGVGGYYSDGSTESGSSGEDSSGLGYTSTGGGHGSADGNGGVNFIGGDGGSGGGSTWSGATSTGIVGQGHGGGFGGTGCFGNWGGGGGGSGAAGSSGGCEIGNGGIGSDMTEVIPSIYGESGWFGGGGGAGYYNSFSGSSIGGQGGGGTNDNTELGESGADNTGGGGACGAGLYPRDNDVSGSGGSGIVIIRYAI
jgi:hypothetical protein